jgi:hypothetical protein
VPLMYMPELSSTWPLLLMPTAEEPAPRSVSGLAYAIDVAGPSDNPAAIQTLAGTSSSRQYIAASPRWTLPLNVSRATVAECNSTYFGVVGLA